MRSSGKSLSKLTIPKPKDDSKKLFIYPIMTHPISSAQLYVSNLKSAQDDFLLNQNKIKYVVNACHIDLICSTYTEFAGIEYLNIDLTDDIGDTLPMISAIRQSHKFIDNALLNGNNVLVHCKEGISRSITIICAYMLLCHNSIVLSLPNRLLCDNVVDRLLDYIRSIKGTIDPNTTFTKLLHEISENSQNWLTIIK